MGSSLDFLKPILKFLPEVESPTTPPSVKEKLIWTGIALIIFFVMYNVDAAGVMPHHRGGTDFLQVITASRLGSLITIGIGPIVLASIFLQLFAGAKIIQVDMNDPEQKKTFQGAQKLLAIFLCFFEATIFIGATVQIIPLFSFLGEGYVTENGITAVHAPFTRAFVILQVALGSLILLYLDEVVSKHGIGSGISLFIAAGVSISVVAGSILLLSSAAEILVAGGAEALPNAILALLPIFFTALVLLVVAYAEGIKIEIPLAFDRAKIGSRFPIKFLYVSNIPVILASALLLNMQYFSVVLQNQHFCITGTYDPEAAGFDKCKGGFDLIPAIAFTDSTGHLRDGLIYMLSPIHRGNNDYGVFFGHLINGKTPIYGLPEWLHVISYIVFMVILCIIFGQFWVETTNMNARDVAEQLDKSGLQIPGHRRDVRAVESVLSRYIPYIVVLGSAFVGLLAALADMTGALGTGTGILLTVGILYRMYQDLENQRMFENYTAFGRILN